MIKTGLSKGLAGMLNSAVIPPVQERVDFHSPYWREDKIREWSLTERALARVAKYERWAVPLGVGGGLLYGLLFWRRGDKK